MLGGSFFTSMDEDPFFAGHRQNMQRMDAMFGDFPFHQPHRNMLGLTNGTHSQQNHSQLMESHRNNQLQQFGMFDNMFGNMFKNMRNMMADMQRGFVDSNGCQVDSNGCQVDSNGCQVSSNQGGPCYSQQSFVSYSKTGNGAPKVYQSSSSVRSGPGGIKETHRTVRDSDSGVEKMAIGRHIHERGHVMERSRNRRTGSEEQNQNFINIDEDDAPSFDREWKEHATTTSPVPRGPRGVRGIEHRPWVQRSQIPVRIQRSHGSSSRLALPSPVTRETSESPRWQPESKRVGFESRRADRRRATPRHRDRD